MDFVFYISAIFITLSVTCVSSKPTGTPTSLFIFKKQCETKCVGNGVSCRQVDQGAYKWECWDGKRPVKGVIDLGGTPWRGKQRLGDSPDPEGCPDCDIEEGWVCPAKKRTWIRDKEVPNPYPNRAIYSVPKGFVVKKSSFPKAGLGAWTTRNISECVVIGPYGGERIYNREDSTLDYAWKITDAFDDMQYLVDAADASKSNWLRYINCAARKEDQNVDAVQYKGEMYYQVTRAIPAGTELLVWYGDAYAKWLGLL